jgi:hypothetical protein
VYYNYKSSIFYIDSPPSTILVLMATKYGRSNGSFHMVSSLKMNTALQYSIRVVQEGDRRCKKSTLSDLAYLTPLRIPLMNPVIEYSPAVQEFRGSIPIVRCSMQRM